MLKSHIDAKEDALVVISRIPANAGHPLHKGTPREAFIKEFLEEHLPSNVSIGTGEIIDANSRPGQTRNQFDIVIYKNNYPRLHFGGGVFGFLIESVIATIEVKSDLSQQELKRAIGAARSVKQLNPNFISVFSSGHIPPKIVNFVVAYDGPATMETVYGWIPQIYQDLEVPNQDLPLNENQRTKTASESIDGIFILKKGFIYFDNTPIGFFDYEVREENPSLKWIYADSPDGNLLLLFLFIQAATANVEGRWLNSLPYLSRFSVDPIKWGA